MSQPLISILLLEDDADHAELVRRAFEATNHPTALRVVGTLHEARQCIDPENPQDLPDLIIADWRLPDGESLELLAFVISERAIPVIMMTSHGNERVAVEAMRQGVLDYIVKSESTLLDMPHLADRALRQWQHVVERKRAEAALRESEDRYRLITERATDIICLVDREGHMAYMSPSVQQALGYAPVTLIGASVFDYIHPQDISLVQERWQELLRYGQAYVTYRSRHADGSWRWLDVQGSLFSEDHSSLAVIVGRDITERRRLEEQLFQAQKLEAIGQLAGGVAHDFNNLLVVIAGSAELALCDLSEDHAVRADIQEILKASQRASNLVRQLLTFARRQMSEPQVVQLNELILDMDKMVRRLIREDIALQILPSPELWPVWADPGQIEQVVLNLVVNARDAMPQGGRLSLETSNVVLEERSPLLNGSLKAGAYVLIVVSDTGTGMTEEVRRHAFEPFFSTKAPGAGTGLGLASCYGIVKQHGGIITIDSELGQGTRIKLYLPKAGKDSHTQGTAPASDQLAGGDETILLVEDDPAVRELAARVLRTQGYQVLEAANGAVALKLATGPVGTTINALLTDLVMPGLSGIELIDQIRLRLPGLPVLLMSGYADNQLLRSELGEQRIAWIQKPFTRAALVGKVRDVLDRREARLSGQRTEDMGQSGS